MARCNMEALIKKVGIDKLSKNVEVSFALHRNLQDCRKINTRHYAALSDEAAVTYNSLRKPQNRFECNRKGCVNSGTLMMGAAGDSVTFKAQYDATDYAAGAVAFYVYTGNLVSSDYPVTLTFKISDVQAMTTADVYTRTITAAEVTDDGYVPIVIDLSKTPSSEVANGWTPGAVSYIQLSADKVVGYSSIAIYDTIEDFETNDVVKVGCLSEVGGSFDVAAVATTCLNAGYDDSVDSIPLNVTGTSVTPNYWKLNPMIGKGTESEGFKIVTIKKTITKSGNYGKLTLSDLFQDECGYVTVQKTEECDTTNSFFKQLSVPTLVDLAEDQFQVIKNADGTTELYFNGVTEGAEVLVSYPKMVDIEEEVMTAENIGETRVRMSYPLETSDGVEYVYIFDNVLITSFPFSINNNSETSFAFSLTIQRDDDGVFVRRRRIVA